MSGEVIDIEHPSAGEWEILIQDTDEYLRRIRVPGGWLYQAQHIATVEKPGEATTWVGGWHAPVFVPDPRSE